MLNELEVKIQKKGEENEIFALLCLLAQGRKFLKKRENWWVVKMYKKMEWENFHCFTSVFG